jgi:uncharacterized OsmC-like protein
MGEAVIVRQDRLYQIEVLARDAHDERSEAYYPVEDVRFLTPYGMLLASLASCTAVVLLTYAEHHGVGLEKVELRVTYDRVYGEDCKTCTDEFDFEERIQEEVELHGELSESDRERLFRVSMQCPIHKMISHGIDIESRLAEGQPSGEEQEA